ncbi:MAG: carboxypeptidase-like regulatory domain-containing protein [Bacteroidia bacterium]|nr:MAG: carboxypeptidase-like regulatory domain-containing protein [Bacteroidia bacterium]
MKKLASICMYLLLGHAAYSQLIKGKIYDNQVQSTVPYASVYFSGTMVGTASDADGNFQLDITKYKSNPLIIRATCCLMNIPWKISRHKKTKSIFRSEFCFWLFWCPGQESNLHDQ